MRDYRAEVHEPLSNDNVAYRFIYAPRGGARQDNLQTRRPDVTVAGGLKFAFPGGGNATVILDYNKRVTSFADQVTFGDERTGLVNEDLHRDHAVYTSLRTPTKNFRFSMIATKQLGPIDGHFSYQYNVHEWEDDALFPFCVCAMGARFRKQEYNTHNLFFDGVWRPQLGGIANVVNFGLAYDKSQAEQLQILNFALDPNDYVEHDIHNPPVNIRFNHASPNNNTKLNALSDTNFFSIYGNWRASFSDERISGIIGVRYQDYTKGSTNRIGDDVPTKDDDITLFRGGIVVKFAPGVNGWVSYGETFNISTALAPPGATVEFLPDPGAENLEGGIKVSLYDRRVNLTAAYYELTQTGRTKSGSSTLIPIEPVADSTNKGIEVQLTAEPKPGWLFIGSLTDQKVRTAEGKRDTDVSEFIANFWTKYTIPEGAMEGLGFGFGMVHYGDKLPFGIPGGGPFGATNPITDYKVPAVTTFDATGSLNRDPWRFAINVRNIEDEIYVNHTSGSFGAHWINNGRTWSISTSYRW